MENLYERLKDDYKSILENRVKEEHPHIYNDLKNELLNATFIGGLPYRIATALDLFLNVGKSTSMYGVYNLFNEIKK